MPRAPRPVFHAVEPATQGPLVAGLDPVSRAVYLELLVTIERPLPFALRRGVAALAEEMERTPAEVEAALGVLAARGLVIRDAVARLIYLPQVLHQAATAPQNPASARYHGSQMTRLPACALRDQMDAAYRAHLEKYEKLGLLDEYCKGRGERLPSSQLELPLPPSVPTPPVLQLITSEPPMSRSDNSLPRGVEPSHAGHSPLCDRQRPAPREEGSGSEQEAWLDFLEKGTHAHEQRDSGSRGPLAAQDRDSAPALHHDADRAPTGGVPGAGVHPEHGWRSAMAAGRTGGAAALLPAAGAVPAGLPTDQALRDQLERFIGHSKDSDGVARVLVAEIDATSIYQLDEAVRRHKALPHELDEMARMLASGEEWGLQRGVQLETLCKKPFRTYEKDHFKALLLKARTPARKPQAKGMPQPALSQHDDLGEVFSVAAPRRSVR